jgi:hypothetical protein
VFVEYRRHHDNHGCRCTRNYDYNATIGTGNDNNGGSGT